MLTCRIDTKSGPKGMPESVSFIAQDVIESIFTAEVGVATLSIFFSRWLQFMTDWQTVVLYPVSPDVSMISLIVSGSGIMTPCGDDHPQSQASPLCLRLLETTSTFL